MLTTYTPSGKTGPLAIYAALALAPIAAASAWLYQFLMELNPFIYLDGIMVIGYAAGLAFITSRVLRFTNCRSKQVAIITGLVVGLAGVAASHYFAYVNILALASKQLNQTITNVPIAEYIRVRMETGWTLGRGGGIEITSYFVWVIWVIEAAIIVAGPVFGGILSADNPFCEACNKWADSVETTIALEQPSPTAVARVRAAQTVVDLLDISPNAPDAAATPEVLNYKLQACPGCDNMPSLSIDHDQTIINGKKTEKKTNSLHKGILLTKEEAQAVRDMAKDFTALEPPQEPAPPIATV